MEVYDSALQFQWPHIRNLRMDHKGIQRAHCPEWNLTCEYSNRGFRKPSKSSRAAFRLFLTKKLSTTTSSTLAELREKKSYTNRVIPSQSDIGSVDPTSGCQLF